MKFLRYGRDEPHIYRFARVYVFIAFFVQIALSGAMLGLGGFYTIFYEVYRYQALYFSYPLYWIAPPVTVIGGLFGISVAFYWFRTIKRPGDNSLEFITSAIIFLILFGLSISPAVALVFYFTLPLPPYLMPIYSHHLAYLVFNQFWLLCWGVFSLPAIVVLIAGGSIQLFNYLIQPQPIPKSMRESPIGTRTSHGLVAAALHREQDRVRETSER